MVANKKGTANSVDVHVGKRLRVRRSLLGLSQEKLAESIGLTFQQVQKYEKGLNRISAGRLFELGKILGVPVSYFFDQFESPSKPKAPSSLMPGFGESPQEEIAGDDMMHSKETMNLLRSYYAITDAELRKDIMKFIKSMAERFDISGDEN